MKRKEIVEIVARATSSAPRTLAHTRRLASPARSQRASTDHTTSVQTTSDIQCSQLLKMTLRVKPDRGPSKSRTSIFTFSREIRTPRGAQARPAVVTGCLFGTDLKAAALLPIRSRNWLGSARPIVSSTPSSFRSRPTSRQTPRRRPGADTTARAALSLRLLTRCRYRGVGFPSWTSSSYPVSGWTLHRGRR